MIYPVVPRPFMMSWKPPSLTRIYILGEPQCWIYAVKASGIHIYDRQIMESYHHTMLLHTDNLHKSWPKGAILVMDQATALFEFLQHISFPQPSHFAFRLICGTNFWLEYQFINDSIFGILWSPYWISGHVNFECILSAQVKRSHSRTWNYTQRSTSSAQWYRSCPFLSFWPFLVVATMDFSSCELCVHF